MVFVKMTSPGPPSLAHILMDYLRKTIHLHTCTTSTKVVSVPCGTYFICIRLRIYYIQTFVARGNDTHHTISKKTKRDKIDILLTAKRIYIKCVAEKLSSSITFNIFFTNTLKVSDFFLLTQFMARLLQITVTQIMRNLCSPVNSSSKSTF